MEHIDPHQSVRLSPQEQIALWREELKPPPPAKKSRFEELINWGPQEKPDALPPQKLHIPLHPDKDILGFISDFSPDLQDWQRDIIDIVRTQSIYFYPQRRTKIMNEGWASFWHNNIMEEYDRQGFTSAAEGETWTILNANILSPRPQQLNPYWLGTLIWRWLADYYNGQLPKSDIHWLQKNDWPVYETYNGPLVDSPAIPKIREIMMTNDDQSFIFNYFNQPIAKRLNGYLYNTHDFPTEEVVYVDTTEWKDIRDFLFNSLTNCGDPYLVVTDANYNENGELLIEHQLENNFLNIEYIEKTLPYLYQLWAPISQKPVNLKTYIMGAEGPEEITFSFDGDEIDYF